jgi:mono/diheme cytochrome c family protein
MRGVATALMIGVAVVGLGVSPAAQKRGGDPEAAKMKNPVAASPASITAGRQLYNRNCRHCHGIRGLGDGPLAPRSPRPPNLTDGQWEFGSSDGEVFTIIANGAGPESEMKGMKGTLSDQEIWHVVNFLRTLGPDAAKR